MDEFIVADIYADVRYIIPLSFEEDEIAKLQPSTGNRLTKLPLSFRGTRQVKPIVLHEYILREPGTVQPVITIDPSAIRFAEIVGDDLAQPDEVVSPYDIQVRAPFLRDIGRVSAVARIWRATDSNQ